MKKINFLTVCSMSLLLGLSSCDITNLNVNQNEPTDDVDYNMDEPLLASTIRGGMMYEGNVEQRYKALQIDLYSQALIDGGGWSTSNYKQNDGWNQLIWEGYQKQFTNLNMFIANMEAKGGGYPNAVAFARLWRVYLGSQAVDCFGPMPFPKNLQDTQYKSVEDIYKECFSELDEAELTDDGGDIFASKANDPIYGASVNKWRAFSNSLRLRLAMRLSEVAPDLCKEQVKKALDGGVFESSSDDAYLPPIADGGWGGDYNYVMFQITWGGPLSMSRSFEKLTSGIGGIDFPNGLKNTSTGIAASANHPAKIDPRATKIFQPAQANGDFRGIPYAPEASIQNAGEYVTKNYAELGYLLIDGAKNNAHPYDLFLYEEVCFLKAEAFLRGFASGDAKSAYEAGVRSSFKHWDAEGVDTYLESTEKNIAGTSAKWEDVTGAGNTQLEKIITQKYIAATPDVSKESWNDKRRLNLPRLDVAIYRDPVAYNGYDMDIKKPQNFIKRMKYPQNEQQLNESEYKKGLQMLGGEDKVNTPLWWDVNANYCTSAE
ncbi:SusD/RagB family nutrient-binding outer membrane lipoprotein [Phocaeicola sp.]